MPAPRIIYEGDEDAAHQHLTVAQNLLHKVRSMAAASGAGVVGQSLAPDTSSFIYALKIGDLEVLHIFSAPETSYVPPSYDFTTLPDFMSGAVRDPRIKTIELPGGGTRVVLDSFRPTADDAKIYELEQTYQPVTRLTVKPHKSIMSGSAPPSWLSQYGPVQASSYSGRMRKLVQVLLGFGRIRPWNIQATDKWGAEVRGEGVQVRYDSRFQRTHIITEAEDERLWLVEISLSNGVLAMPLPVYDDSRYLEGSERESISEAVKLFKGLPSGRPFPSGKELKALLKAGLVLRLAEASALTEYGRLTPYSSAMGWCCNEKGTEAHNTGFYMHEDNIYRSRHYSLQIQIGKTKKRRDPDEPIAEGSAKLALVAEGKFYHPSKRFPPPIKFYEPLLGGLLSVEFLSAFGAATSPEELPLMDTTMHVFYSDDQLKKVNYFWDRSVKSEMTVVEDTRDDCMFVGAWSYHTESSLSLFPTFYTTDVDDRERPENSFTKNNWVGRDLGYWVYGVSDDSSRAVFPQWASVWRSRAYRLDFRSETVNDRSIRAAIVVPGGIRDGCVYAKITYSGSSSINESVSFRSLRDPNNYYSYRYFYDSYKPVNECWSKSERRMREVYYTPPPTDSTGVPIGPDCYELVDQGPWLEVCDSVDHLPATSIPRSFSQPTVIEPQKTEVKATMYLDNEFDRAVQLTGVDKENDEVWRARTPDLDFPDIVQQFNATFSVFSRTNQIVHHKTINGERDRIGSLVADSTDKSHFFVGYT